MEPATAQKTKQKYTQHTVSQEQKKHTIPKTTQIFRCMLNNLSPVKKINTLNLHSHTLHIILHKISPYSHSTVSLKFCISLTICYKPFTGHMCSVGPQDKQHLISLGEHGLQCSAVLSTILRLIYVSAQYFLPFLICSMQFYHKI